MNRKQKNRNMVERLSTLLDGESADPESDRLWLASDETAAQRYRHYQRIREELHALTAPKTTPDFAERVLARLPENGKRHAIGIRYALAASLLFAMSGAILYFALQPSPETLPDSPLTAIEAPIVMQGMPSHDEQEFWNSLTDTSDYYGMTLSLDSLEEIPEDTLLCLLIEMALEETTQKFLPEEEEYKETEQDLWPATVYSPSFLTLFDFVETLDEEEADALNQALRSALEEA